MNPNAPNFGVRPLPNLETKIVAADALMPIEGQHQHQFDLFDVQIRQLREGLELVQHEHFNARTPEKKAKSRERDAELRRHIADALRKTGLPDPTASALAAWDPYDQNKAALFFDPAWMFSIKDGEYLRPFKKRLVPDVPGGRKPGSYEWYEIQDNIAYWQEFEQSKVLYPDIYEHQSFTWDEQGFYAANTCYFIPTEEKWLTALLNSSAIEWFYSQISSKVRGGYLRAFSDYMQLIPIPKATEVNRDVIARLVDYLLWLNRPSSNGNVSQIPGYFEQLLNGLVYELFFPDELYVQKLFLFRYVEEAKLPVLSEIPEAKRFAALRETFERIYDLKHPIRGCLFSLGSLETVRIIEGEA